MIGCKLGQRQQGGHGGDIIGSERDMQRGVRARRG